MNVLNACFNLSWEAISKLHLNFTANYWAYVFTDVTKDVAWHKPVFQFVFNGKYIHNRMIFDLNFNLDFARKGMAFDTEGTPYAITMKPIIDVGVGFEYRITNRFSAFAKVSNLANQHYAQFYNFKSFGINGLLGVTYSFGDESLKKKK